ncbi:hypothetical protein HMPREF2531_04565 [Bacteroides intestinalis]|uniref:Uncharacterized protein n=1 Tax=Bacteroides intestinalis TaxID=329854 RepID=A0A139KUQ5_9BACE|nr:hypothetical protein HMPREF2531_04565 [Bacteroides intestinalis]
MKPLVSCLETLSFTPRNRQFHRLKLVVPTGGTNKCKVSPYRTLTYINKKI